MDERKQGFDAYNLGYDFDPEKSAEWREGWRDAQAIERDADAVGYDDF